MASLTSRVYQRDDKDEVVAELEKIGWMKCA